MENGKVIENGEAEEHSNLQEHAGITVDNIIIDTDCGVDDMFCIANFLSLHKKNTCKVLGITTVCGNIPTEAAYQNTCKLVKDVFGVEDVPVFKSNTSCFNDQHCSLFYGDDGHCGVLSRLSDVVHKQSASSAEEFLISTLKREPLNVTIIAIGPLTNLHTAEKMSPGILENAKQIIIMGGNILAEGNCPKTNFASEYNFGMDGGAAKCVLAANPNVSIVPLDATNIIRFGIDSILEKTRTEKQKVFFSDVMSGALEAMVREGECSPDDRRLNIHDVHCFIYFLNPELYVVQEEALTVDNDGVISRNTDTCNSVKVTWQARDEEKIEELVTLMFENLL